MTKRALRRRRGLLAPRRPKKSRADARDYGHNALEMTIDEMLAPAHVDEASKRADHLLLTGPLFAYLEALIDTAMAHSGALNTDEEPEHVLCEATGMSHLEYEAVVLRAEGVDWSRIAKSQAVSLEAAAAAGKSGVRKLRNFVRT